MENADALRRIVLARRGARFSRSSSASRCALLLVVPCRSPASTSTWLTHPRSVSGLIPSCSPIRPRGVLEVLADEKVTVLSPGLPRKLYARGHAPAVRWYVDLTLPCGHAHIELQASSKDDARTGFNRPEHLRMHPPGALVYT